MKPRISVTLLGTISILLAGSLSAVSLVVLASNYRLAASVSEREVAAAAADVGHRVAGFLGTGPAALRRIQRLFAGSIAAFEDPDRLARILAAEAGAEPELAWVSVAQAATGDFIGVNRRGARLVVNRSSPARDGGIPREWLIQADGRMTPLPVRSGTAPYDPRTRPWFTVASLGGVRWTDPYEFAEGVPGISAVAGIQGPGADDLAGVATADFRLDGIERFLENLVVGTSGRVAVIAPVSGGGNVLLGVGRPLPPEMRAALADASASLSGKGHEGAAGRRQYDGEVVVDVRPLAIADGPSWSVALMVPRREIEAPIRNAATRIVALAGGFLALGMLAAIWLARAIARPIGLVSRDLAEIGRLRFSDTDPPRSFVREVDAMAVSAGRMKAGLRSFSSYVPTEVVRAVLDSGRAAALGGEMRPLTIFFSDVAGYTRIAEATPPERLVPRLGAYFDLVEQAIVASGGIVDKFMGDGIIAFFNAPLLLHGHEQKACEAAAEVQRRLGAFDREGRADGWPPFATRIGLASGEVLVGNIGTPRRLSYTAIGDAVNLASRLEALNKTYGTSTLATGEVRHAAGVGLEWRHLDRVTVAGRQEPLELHELLGAAGEVDADRLGVRDLHEAALAAHLLGDFDAAERGFAAILEAFPGEKAAGILLAHTIEARTQMSRRGRQGAWTGVHAHTRKP